VAPFIFRVSFLGATCSIEPISYGNVVWVAGCVCVSQPVLYQYN